MVRLLLHVSTVRNTRSYDVTRVNRHVQALRLIQRGRVQLFLRENASGYHSKSVLFEIQMKGLLHGYRHCLQFLRVDYIGDYNIFMFFFSLCLAGTRNSWEVCGCRVRHVAPVYDLWTRDDGKGGIMIRSVMAFAFAIGFLYESIRIKYRVILFMTLIVWSKKEDINCYICYSLYA